MFKKILFIAVIGITIALIGCRGDNQNSKTNSNSAIDQNVATESTSQPAVSTDNMKNISVKTTPVTAPGSTVSETADYGQLPATVNKQQVGDESTTVAAPTDKTESAASPVENSNAIESQKDGTKVVTPSAGNPDMVAPKVEKPDVVSKKTENNTSSNVEKPKPTKQDVDQGQSIVPPAPQTK